MALFGSSNQTTTTTQNVDPTVRQYGIDTMNLASGVAGGFQPPGIGSMPLWTGQKVAGMSPMERMAGGRIAQGNLNPFARQAAGGIMSAMNSPGGQSGPLWELLSGGGLGQMALGSAQRYGGGFDVSPFSMDAVKSIANPYVSALNESVQRQADVNRNTIRSRAAAANAFGGDRAALMERENQGSADRLMNENQARAYETAQGLLQTNRALELQQQLARSGQFNTEQDRGLQATGQIGNLAQLLAAIQNQGRGIQLQGAGQLGSLGELMRTGRQDDINNMMRFGGLQRGINQAGLDFDYDQFVQARDWPARMLQLRTAAMGGMPVSQSQTTTQPGPGLLQQLLGGGLAIAGMGGPSGFGWWGS